MTPAEVLRRVQPLGWLLVPWVLASLIWTLVQVWYPVNADQGAVAQPSSATPQVLWIQDFSRYWQPTQQTARKVEPVVQPSRLAVQIQGVFLSDQAGRSVVLLKYRNKDRTLSEGDLLEPGIQLVSIQQDVLVFERNGQLEQVAVRLDEKSPRQTLNSAEPVAQNEQPAEAAAAERHEQVGTRVLEDTFGPDFREKLLRDPLQLMRYMTLAPQSQGGQLQGFRVNPGSDASLFNALGLQPGDLLVAVDGIPVSDTPQMMALTSRLQSASAVEVELLRGNEKIIISLEME